MQSTNVLIQTIIGGIGIGSLYALVALGTTMTYRSMGLINFAHGSIYMVGTYLGIIWYQGMVFGLHVPFPIAFIIGVSSKCFFGIFSGTRISTPGGC